MADTVTPRPTDAILAVIERLNRVRGAKTVADDLATALRAYQYILATAEDAHTVLCEYHNGHDNDDSHEHPENCHGCAVTKRLDEALGVEW